MPSQTRIGGIAIAAALLAAAAPAPVSRATAPVEGKVLGFEASEAADSVNAPLVAGARFTAMDLLKRVFPDLGNDGRYRTIEPVKPVPGAVAPEIGAGYAQGEGEPSLTMDPPTAAVVRDGRHAIGFVLGGGVLVADWLLPAPAVGQAIYVATDPGGQPAISRAFAVRPGEAVALVLNSHHNAGEGFASYSMFAQGFSGLRQVYSGPDLYSFTQAGTGNCGALINTQTLDSVRPLARRHGGYADIAMNVTEKVECDGAESRVISTRKFPFTLVWNARAKRYRGGSPELERINKRRWD